MAETASEIQVRFLQRIERRARFLKTLLEAGLGLYLPTDEAQRGRAIDQIVRMTARQTELPHLTQDTLARATTTVRNHLEAMQKVLPHDVQYRNRIKRDW